MGARSLLTLRTTSWGSRDRIGRIARGEAMSRPMGAVAIRMPERVSAHLSQVFPSASPKIFVHEGARQSLERRLMAASPAPVSLSVTDNRHSIISQTWERGVLKARVHHMFLDAPHSIQTALIKYVTHGDAAASARLGNYIEANNSRLAKRKRSVPLISSGEHHDLLKIFHELNERYFNGAVNALISWGRAQPRRGNKRPRSAIKLGSYDENERLIRIHPALDRKWVPRYFVAYVLYHEMLHHMFPTRRPSDRPDRAFVASRRSLHPPEFLEQEKQFAQYERAIRWEKLHIGRLLRS